MEVGINSSCLRLITLKGTLYSGCYKMFCESTSKLIIKINTNYFECLNENQLINISNHSTISQIICPSPSIICNGRIFSSKILNNPKKIPFPNDSINNNNFFNLKNLLFLSFGIIILIILIIIFLNLNNKNDESTLVSTLL